MASTPSVLAISGTESVVFLKCITEVREITRRPRMLDKPSDKLLGDAVGQVFLRGISAQVLQRKHS